LLLGYIVLI